MSRVLVVEPDEDARLLHGQLLRHIGCEVVEAVDGRDGLVKALTYNPALVMTELHLPFFDGQALCELLRRDSMTRSVPILVITTERGRAQLERARATGADACLVKPATLDALSHQIRHLLGAFGEAQRARATRERPPPRSTTSTHRAPHPAPGGISAESSQRRTSGSRPPRRPSDRRVWSVPRAITHFGTNEAISVGSAVATRNSGTSSCVRLEDRAEYSSIDN